MNLNFDISERDKKILMIGIGIVLIVLSYMLGYKNITAANADLKVEVDGYKKTFNRLQEMATQQGKYQEGAEDYKEKYNVYLQSFNQGNLEDDELAFFMQCEEKTGATITQVGWSDTIDAYQFGNITNSNPDLTGQPSGAPATYQGKSVSYSVVCNGTYEQLKEVIKFVQEGSGRKVITDVAASYDESTDLISATMTVVDYYIITGDEYKASFTKPEVSVGTSNIFNSAK